LFPGFNQDLKTLNLKLDDFSNKANSVAENKEIAQLVSLFKRIDRLRAIIDSSESFINYCKFIERKSQVADSTIEVDGAHIIRSTKKILEQTGVNMSEILKNKTKKEAELIQKNYEEYKAGYEREKAGLQTENEYLLVGNEELKEEVILICII